MYWGTACMLSHLSKGHCPYTSFDTVVGLF